MKERLFLQQLKDLKVPIIIGITIPFQELSLRTFQVEAYQVDQFYLITMGITKEQQQQLLIFLLRIILLKALRHSQSSGIQILHAHF